MFLNNLFFLFCFLLFRQENFDTYFETRDLEVPTVLSNSLPTSYEADVRTPEINEKEPSIVYLNVSKEKVVRLKNVRKKGLKTKGSSSTVKVLKTLENILTKTLKKL